MTDELRLVLLAAGLVIIAYIVWDATRRKKSKNNGYQFEKNSLKKIKSSTIISSEQSNDEIDTTSIDDDGFDELGLAEPREKGMSPQHSEVITEENSFDELQELQHTEKAQRLEPSFTDEDESSVSKESHNDIILEEPSINDDILESSNVKTLKKPEAVIAINLMALSDAPFEGNQLLQELLTLGFKYGEMGIFHRYRDPSGQGERWFSLANAFNPGNFDIDNMSGFSTEGLTLFMLLPGPQDPIEAFNMMLSAAQKLRILLGGKLEDGSHSVLSPQRIQMYKQEIKDFLRKQQIEIHHSDD